MLPTSERNSLLQWYLRLRHDITRAIFNIIHYFQTKPHKVEYFNSTSASAHCSNASTFKSTNKLLKMAYYLRMDLICNPTNLYCIYLRFVHRLPFWLCYLSIPGGLSLFFLKNLFLIFPPPMYWLFANEFIYIYFL